MGEIALAVGLPRSTVQRIVAALVDEQFLIAAAPKSRVTLGPALIRLAQSTNIKIDEFVRPLMQTLCRELEETVDLSVIQGDVAIFIDQILGSHRLRAVSAIGETFPLHCTANGKALLATLPPDKLDKILKSRLKPYTTNTVTDPELIRREIEQIKKDKIAYDIEEHTNGICALGTSFEDPVGRCFAISIPVPATRFSRNEERIKSALHDFRQQIMIMLGTET